MDDLNYNVAVNLKRIRREKGMSLEGMAEQTGVSKSMLAQIEKGIANPSLGVIGKIIGGFFRFLRYFIFSFNIFYGSPEKNRSD